MKKLFSSGEVLYKENSKKLKEGLFSAEFLEYDRISNESFIKAFGDLEGKTAEVIFRIKETYLPNITFKQSINILMQSDVFQTEWEEYKIEYK